MIATPGELKIVGIGGSLREGSCSYLALEYAIGLLRQMGCQTRILDLRLMPLPFCDGDNEDPRPDFPGVAELRREVLHAHGLILCTPEYHGGVSGVLKNALDLLTVEHLSGKVAGVISVLGGVGSVSAINELARILRCCHAWVLPESIAIARAKSVFQCGSITDTDLLNRFRRFARSLAWSAARIADSDGQMTACNQTTGGFHETLNASLTFLGDAREPAGHARSIDRQ